MIENALPGDILLTYGKARWWPPKYWVRAPLYAQIRDYQKGELIRLCSEVPDLLIPEHPISDSTHVYIVIDTNLLFEFTHPRARFISVADSMVMEKGFTLCRHTRIIPPGTVELTERCIDFEGSKYDIGDLLDFRISGWLKLLGKLRIFGDKDKKLQVCSTGAMAVLSAYGVTSEVPAFPAWFENVKRDWRIVARYNR